ncbi:MAG: ABC transporter ATP-binding protein [Christensenellales bacterium]
MNKHLLDIKDLRVSFFTPGGEVQAVRGVSWFLDEGEAIGIVGESGSGKSVTAYSIMRLLQSPGKIVGGSINFDGKDIVGLTVKELRKIRGNKIAMIFQDPMTSLNPVYTIGNQIAEPLRLHLHMNKTQATERTIELISSVGIPNPQRRVKQYPFEFSGGMRQRAMISMALACEPKLLIADEPTTALDVTIQAQILEIMKELKARTKMSIILITHDLGIVSDICDKIMIMYGGEIVEYGPISCIVSNPSHQYTLGLIKSLPKIDQSEKEALTPIEGSPVDLMHPPAGCPFAPRCSQCMKVCLSGKPPYFEIEKDHYSACWLHYSNSDRKGQS